MSKIKLHLGCGSVYLKGYINSDLQGVPARLHPQVKKHNETTTDKYYKWPFRSNLINDCYDIKMDATDLSAYEDDSVDEILAVNVLEHIPKNDMLKAAEDHWYRVLKPGGLLILDTPDIIKTCQEVIKYDKDFKQLEERLYWLFCHGRQNWDIHRWGYTTDYLNHLLEPIGFKFVNRDDGFIKHDAGYPYFINFYTK